MRLITVNTDDLQLWEKWERTDPLRPRSRYPFQTSPVPSERDLSSHRSTPGVSSGPHCLLWEEWERTDPPLPVSDLSRPVRPWSELSPQHPRSLQRPTLSAVRGVRAHRSSVTRFRPLPSRQTVIWALTAAPQESPAAHTVCCERSESAQILRYPFQTSPVPSERDLSSHRSTPGVSSGPHCLLWKEWERTDPPLPVSDLSRPIRAWSELSPQHPGSLQRPTLPAVRGVRAHRSSVTRFRPLPSRQSVIWALTTAPQESPAVHTACCERSESTQILRYPFQTSPVPSDRDLSSHRSTPGVSSGPHCLLWEEPLQIKLIIPTPTVCCSPKTRAALSHT